MKQFFFRLAALIWIEISGVWLITQHRYMYFELMVYTIMTAAALIWIVLEIFRINTINDNITDILISGKDPEGEEDE